MGFWFSVFAGLYYWFVQTNFGYTLTDVFWQPLVMSLPIGLLLGDVPTALIIGATIQLIYLGIVPAGGNLPSDSALAGIIAIPLALKTNMSPEVAVSIAVPIGILGMFLKNILRTMFAFFVNRADKFAAVGNTKGIFMCATLLPFATGFVLRFPPVFLANYYGESVIGYILEVIPEWIMHGFEVAGGILPALGFAVIILTIGKPKFIPFFIMAFFMVQYLGINTMAAAIFGTCIALLITFMSKKQQKEAA